MKPVLSKAQSGKPSLGAHPGMRPPVAVEITPGGVLAAALPTGSQTPVFAWAPMDSSILTPGIAEANIHNANALADALRSSIGQCSPRGRAITLILPDPSIRVFVLDFESLPTREAEAIPVLRFRLRRMVPFEVEHAGVSYQILSQTRDEIRVLAAIIPAPVLAEYEAVVRAAGFETGSVLSSSLAALAGISSLESTLVANMGSNSLTTMIANGDNLLLYRSVELPQDLNQLAAEVQRNIVVAAAFFEDKLGARPGSLFYAGTEPLSEFAAWVNEPELPVAELAPRTAKGFVTSTAPISTASVSGALAGAR